MKQTTPTQAQIEELRAEGKIAAERGLRIGHYCLEAADTIERLAAAAQVGECVPSTFLPPEQFKLAAKVGELTPEQIEARWERKFADAVKRIENKTIERCAQVAQRLGNVGDSSDTAWFAEKIATEIRALKDK